MRAKLKKAVRLILSYIPQPLPIGRQAHEAWASEIIALAGMPDNDSMRFAVAVMVLHAERSQYTLSKQSFVKQLKRSAANEVAGALMSELKAKQKAAADEQQRVKEASEQVVS